MQNRTCIYCGQRISPLLSLSGERRFCSQSHRAEYQKDMERLALESLLQSERAIAEQRAHGRALMLETAAARELPPAPEPAVPEIAAHLIQPPAAALSQAVARAWLEPVLRSRKWVGVTVGGVEFHPGLSMASSIPLSAFVRSIGGVPVALRPGLSIVDFGLRWDVPALRMERGIGGLQLAALRALAVQQAVTGKAVAIACGIPDQSCLGRAMPRRGWVNRPFVASIGVGELLAGVPRLGFAIHKIGVANPLPTPIAFSNAPVTAANFATQGSVLSVCGRLFPVAASTAFESFFHAPQLVAAPVSFRTNLRRPGCRLGTAPGAGMGSWGGLVSFTVEAQYQPSGGLSSVVEPVYIAPHVCNGRAPHKDRGCTAPEGALASLPLRAWDSDRQSSPGAEPLRFALALSDGRARALESHYIGSAPLGTFAYTEIRTGYVVPASVAASLTVGAIPFKPLWHTAHRSQIELAMLRASQGIWPLAAPALRDTLWPSRGSMAALTADAIPFAPHWHTAHRSQIERAMLRALQDIWPLAAPTLRDTLSSSRVSMVALTADAIPFAAHWHSAHRSQIELAMLRASQDIWPLAAPTLRNTLSSSGVSMAALRARAIPFAAHWHSAHRSQIELAMLRASQGICPLDAPALRDTLSSSGVSMGALRARAIPFVPDWHSSHCSQIELAMLRASQGIWPLAAPALRDTLSSSGVSIHDCRTAHPYCPAISVPFAEAALPGAPVAETGVMFATVGTVLAAAPRTELPALPTSLVAPGFAVMLPSRRTGAAEPKSPDFGQIVHRTREHLVVAAASASAVREIPPAPLAGDLSPSAPQAGHRLPDCLLQPAGLCPGANLRQALASPDPEIGFNQFAVSTALEFRAPVQLRADSSTAIRTAWLVPLSFSAYPPAPPSARTFDTIAPRPEFAQVLQSSTASGATEPNWAGSTSVFAGRINPLPAPDALIVHVRELGFTATATCPVRRSRDVRKSGPLGKSPSRSRVTEAHPHEVPQFRPLAEVNRGIFLPQVRVSTLRPSIILSSQPANVVSINERRAAGQTASDNRELLSATS